MNFKNPTLTYDGLVLYHHPYSIHSQKVLIVLHEKTIKFTSYIIDMANGEQYSDWFLNLNPAGDVPVLQDGCFIIPNSNQIINYLESKFKSENIVRLLPTTNDNESQRILYFQNIINRLPIGAISLGSFIHTDLKLNPKAPFIGPIRNSCLETNDKVHAILKSSMESKKVYFTSLNRKIDLQERRQRLISDRAEFQKLLNSTENVLKLLNSQLASNTDTEWICTKQISVADIALGLLLNRLNTLGFENYFWANDKLPWIQKYWEMFQNRKSFKDTVPTSVENFKAMWEKAPSSYKLGAGVLGMAIFAASALAHKI